MLRWCVSRSSLWRHLQTLLFSRIKRLVCSTFIFIIAFSTESRTILLALWKIEFINDAWLGSTNSLSHNFELSSEVHMTITYYCSIGAQPNETSLQTSHRMRSHINFDEQQTKVNYMSVETKFAIRDDTHFYIRSAKRNRRERYRRRHGSNKKTCGVKWLLKLFWQRSWISVSLQIITNV